MSMQKNRASHAPRTAERTQAERVWIDSDAFPDPEIRSWCGAHLALIADDREMPVRLKNFMQAHARCLRGECRVKSAPQAQE
jgi:hypothetical protein